VGTAAAAVALVEVATAASVEGEAGATFVAAVVVGLSTMAAAAAVPILTHLQLRTSPRFPASSAQMIHPMARLLLPQSPNRPRWLWPA